MSGATAAGEATTRTLATFIASRLQPATSAPLSPEHSRSSCQALPAMDEAAAGAAADATPSGAAAAPVVLQQPPAVGDGRPGASLSCGQRPPRPIASPRRRSAAHQSSAAMLKRRQDRRMALGPHQGPTSYLPPPHRLHFRFTDGIPTVPPHPFHADCMHTDIAWP